MKQVFVTATGTDVGKTVITCALTHQLVQAGHAVRTIKPVISGYTQDTAASIDTAEIIQALGHDMTPETIAQVSPWRFTHPLSPDMAATREGRAIDYQDLLTFCRPNGSGESDVDYLVIEGVGGAFVPLDDTHLVVDWILDMNMPAIVVAGSYLGTLSHTVATFEAMQGRGVSVSAIVISESEVSPVPLAETADAMRRLIPGIPVVTVPRLDHWTQAPDLTGLIG